MWATLSRSHARSGTFLRVAREGSRSLTCPMSIHLDLGRSVVTVYSTMCVHRTGFGFVRSSNMNPIPRPPPPPRKRRDCHTRCTRLSTALRHRILESPVTALSAERRPWGPRNTYQAYTCTRQRRRRGGRPRRACAPPSLSALRMCT